MEQIKLKEISVKDLHVLVFRTNIDKHRNMQMVCGELMKISGVYFVNVDMDDWEKVLRVECKQTISIKQIEELMFLLGFECAELTT